METVDSLQTKLTIEELKKKLHTDDAETVGDLWDLAAPLIHGRAAYRVAYIDHKDDDSVMIAGTRFSSRVLRKNLDDVGRVFPFVVTIGGDLEAQADQSADILQKYYLDEIGNIVLRKARLEFESYLRQRFALDKISCMAPGSLQDWPIEEQRPLFGLLGDTREALGVRLTSSMLMLPRKTVSGIYFPSESTFFSCQLCPRERCDGRKAKYNKALAREYGVEETTG